MRYFELFTQLTLHQAAHKELNESRLPEKFRLPNLKSCKLHGCHQSEPVFVPPGTVALLVALQCEKLLDPFLNHAIGQIT